MSRDITTAMATAVDQPHVDHFLLLQVDLDSGSLYLTSAPHDVPYGGHTYLAASGIGSIQPVTEVDGMAAGLEFTLSLVNEAAIASALTEHVQDRSVTLRWAVVDAGTLRVDDVAWKGRFDVQVIEDGPEPVLRVTAEHAMIRWDQPPGVLFSHADQQDAAPGDLFFEHAAKMVDATLVWPSRAFFER